MFEFIGRSFSLMKQSFGFLMQNKKFAIFPILSGICSIIFVYSIVLGLGLWKTDPTPLWGFAFYFGIYFIIIFFNCALIGSIISKLNGKNPTIFDGIKIALNNIGGIIGWTIIGGTIGLVLTVISRKNDDNAINKIIISIIGAAWSAITYFIVPVLVMERVGPFKAIKRSAEIVKKNLAETVVGETSFFLVFAILGIVGIIIALFIIPIIAKQAGVILGLITAVILIIYIAILMLLYFTLTAIFSALLYYQSTTKQVKSWSESYKLY